MSDQITPENRRPSGRKLRGGVDPSVGQATRFKPGQSGNPGGRPASAPFAAAARKVASMKVEDLRVNPKDDAALAAAKVMAREALKGRPGAYETLASRCEGKPVLPISSNGPLVGIQLESWVQSAKAKILARLLPEDSKERLLELPPATKVIS